jgi:Family of unknown function (DUF6184)
MTFDHRNLIIVGSAALLGLVACEKNQSSDQTSTTGATRETPQNQNQPNTTTQPNLGTNNMGTNTGTNTGTMAANEAKDANDTTIDRLTDARCKREVACNNLGNGKKYNDESACRREVRQNVHSDFRQSECHVVLTDKVQSCIDEIQAEKCGSAFDFSRMNACRKGNLCKD